MLITATNPVTIKDTSETLNRKQKLHIWWNINKIIIWNNRRHCLPINQMILEVTRGIPQGSILRPLLFNLYINHIANALATANVLSISDDTTLYFWHTDLLKFLYSNCNFCMQNIFKWLCVNMICLTADTTNYLIISTPDYKWIANSSNWKYWEGKKYNFWENILRNTWPGSTIFNISITTYQEAYS